MNTNLLQHLAAPIQVAIQQQHELGNCLELQINTASLLHKSLVGREREGRGEGWRGIGEERDRGGEGRERRGSGEGEGRRRREEERGGSGRERGGRGRKREGVERGRREEGKGGGGGNSYTVQMQVRQWCYLDKVFGYSSEPGDYLHQCVVAGRVELVL